MLHYTINKDTHWNDLSPKLRKELEGRVKGFGNSVRYHFKISHKNPDPQKTNGEFIWPFIYTLDPITFNIIDPHEEREGKTRSKKIGLIKGTNDENRLVFYRIRVGERHKGVLYLDLTNDEQFNMAMYLELHPKNSNGMFPDKNMFHIATRIDEAAEAKNEREQRRQKKTALDYAYAMKDDEVTEFASGMGWDYQTADIQRNVIEKFAEESPEIFNDLVKEDRIKTQAVIKKAIENNIINSNPAEGKLTFVSTGQTIVVLGMGDGTKTDLERYGEWFATSGDKATEMLKKLKSLVNKPVTS